MTVAPNPKPVPAALKPKTFVPIPKKDKTKRTSDFVQPRKVVNVTTGSTEAAAAAADSKLHKAKKQKTTTNPLALSNTSPAGQHAKGTGHANPQVLQPCCPHVVSMYV